MPSNDTPQKNIVKTALPELLRDNPIVKKALNYAFWAHRDQKDDTGADYFTVHIEQVVSILLQVTDDPDTIAAAYLHDTVEDTRTTPFQLLGMFGEKITQIVLELTKEPETGTFHITSPQAQLIKFADRLSNLSRMESWTEEKKREYRQASRFWTHA